jgi:hypothetical protein
MRTADAERRQTERLQMIEAARGALDSDTVGTTRSLSRRCRWQVLARDVRGDLAIVAVARRGKRAGLTIETHCFGHEGNAWTWKDQGPAKNFDDVDLPPRRSIPRDTFSEASVHGGDTTGSQTELWLLTREAAWVREGDRIEPVPDHGWVVRIRSALDVGRSEVLDVDGAVIGHLGPLGPPWVQWLLDLDLHRSASGDVDDGWFNEVPDG